MKIDAQGHYVFENRTQINEAVQLIRRSMLDGWVDTSHHLWKEWIDGYAKNAHLSENVLTWTAVFIPKLMFAVIKVAV